MGRLYHCLLSGLGVRPPPLDSAFLGPRYSERQVANAIEEVGRFVHAERMTRARICESAAAAIADAFDLALELLQAESLGGPHPRGLRHALGMALPLLWLLRRRDDPSDFVERESVALQ